MQSCNPWLKNDNRPEASAFWVCPYTPELSLNFHMKVFPQNVRAAPELIKYTTRQALKHSCNHAYSKGLHSQGLIEQRKQSWEAAAESLGQGIRADRSLPQFEGD